MIIIVLQIEVCYTLLCFYLKYLFLLFYNFLLIFKNFHLCFLFLFYFHLSLLSDSNLNCLCLRIVYSKILFKEFSNPIHLFYFLKKNDCFHSINLYLERSYFQYSQEILRTNPSILKFNQK